MPSFGVVSLYRYWDLSYSYLHTGTGGISLSDGYVDFGPLDALGELYSSHARTLATSSP